MKMNELNTLGRSELQRLLVEERAKLEKNRMAVALRTESKHTQIRHSRLLISRILTRLHQLDLGIGAATPPENS